MKASNNIHFTRDAQLNGVEISFAEESRHVFPRHSHEKIYALSLMESGGSYWNGRRKSSSLVLPGEFALINPGEVHSGEPVRQSGSTYKMLYISSERFQHEGILPRFDNIIKDDPYLARLYSSLYEAVGSDKDTLLKDSAITEFSGYLRREYGSPEVRTEKITDERKALERAMEYLSSDLEEKATLNETARISGFSSYHFLRLFKKHTGMTPHVFRTQIRLDMARKLILKGKSPAEVAAETGFTDQSHFSKTFSNYFGATPKQYFSAK